MQVVNHGFGGATVDELLYYYNRMVKTYHPSAVVLRPGHNDLTRGLSPEEAWFLTRRLIAWIQTDFPSAKIAVPEVFDTKNADYARCRLNAAYNRLMREFCREHNIPAIDLSPFFHHQDGAFRDVFVEDGLHLTDDGYAQMAAWLVPQISNFLQN